ncbi:MAG TPA: hypothetical protein VFT79_13475 [Solirubrobacterales bacterium]|nr:hypothetical protein [Solirubrobacterales bacterium]
MANGLRLLIDNTTLHRLSFALEPRPLVNHLEAANILHLIECLILAEQLTVARFESIGSQERSDRILNWLESTESRGLVQVSPLSDEARQLDLAAEVAAEMFDRGWILLPGSGYGDIDEIDVPLGRPGGVVERASEFWGQATSLDRQSLQLRAAEEVATHRTDGLFVYGVSQHEEIVSRLNHAYENGGRPSKEQWDKMHVVFRTLFNQQLADRHEGQSYAPPPVRAKVLRTVYFRTITHLRTALNEVAFGLHTEMDNPEFAEELLQTATDPLPLLGLAYMLQANAAEGPTAPFEHRLQAARELAAPMRARLARLENLAKSDSSRYLRELKAEAELLEDTTRSQLGLQRSDGLGFQLDLGVTVDPATGVPALRVGVNGKALSKVRERIKKGVGRKRVSVLSDGLVETVRHKNVAEAVRHVVR